MSDRSANNGAAGGIAVAAASNDPAILAANLRLSPAIAGGALPLHVETDAPSAAIAYNRALDATDAPVVVFAHHDVYLPLGWEHLLRHRIAEVAARDPGWAVIAPFGVSLARTGFGPVWSTSLGAIVGRVAREPVPVQSVDELVIVLRRDAGLRFDESLPGFHLYGTDIVQTARAAGRGAYAVALPVIHNDRFKDELDASFAAAFQHQRRKWRAQLPIHCPVIRIAWHGLDLGRHRRRARQSYAFRQGLALPVAEDPRRYAALCGWGDLGAPGNLWPAQAGA